MTRFQPDSIQIGRDMFSKITNNFHGYIYYFRRKKVTKVSMEPDRKIEVVYIHYRNISDMMINALDNTWV